MSIDLEFAVSKDIRNNPVVREFDAGQKREFRGLVWMALLAVALLLFSAWQRYVMFQYNVAIEQRRADEAYEQTANRQLRLNLETERAPQRVDARARAELGLVSPTDRNTIVLERAPTTAPSSSMVALAR
jgi:cell division protein FtsL